MWKAGTRRARAQLSVWMRELPRGRQPARYFAPLPTLRLVVLAQATSHLETHCHQGDLGQPGFLVEARMRYCSRGIACGLCLPRPRFYRPRTRRKSLRICALSGIAVSRRPARLRETLDRSRPLAGIRPRRRGRCDRSGCRKIHPRAPAHRLRFWPGKSPSAAWLRRARRA